MHRPPVTRLKYEAGFLLLKRETDKFSITFRLLASPVFPGKLTSNNRNHKPVELSLFIRTKVVVLTISVPSQTCSETTPLITWGKVTWETRTLIIPQASKYRMWRKQHRGWEKSTRGWKNFNFFHKNIHTADNLSHFNTQKQKHQNRIWLFTLSGSKSVVEAANCNQRTVFLAQAQTHVAYVVHCKSNLHNIS